MFTKSHRIHLRSSFESSEHHSNVKLYPYHSPDLRLCRTVGISSRSLRHNCLNILINGPAPHVFRFGFSHRSTKTDNCELIHPQRRSYVERITLRHYLPIFIYSHDTPLNSPTVVRQIVFGFFIVL